MEEPKVETIIGAAQAPARIKQRINRQTWLRGKGSVRSRLLCRSNQKRCCLGTVLGDAGMPDEALLDRSAPSIIEVYSEGKYKIPTSMQWLLDEYGLDSDACACLMKINDSMSIDDDERERQLIAVFAENGVDVEFFTPQIVLSKQDFGSFVIGALRQAGVDVIIVE